MHRKFRFRAVLVIAAFAMSMVASAHAFEILGTKVAPGTRADMRIEVPAGDTDPATYIPITVIVGAKPGPVLLMSSGVHGYEFAPILAAERIANEIDPAALSGTLLITRPSHVNAFEARSTYVNPYDRKNLNRSFPGDPEGTQTERIAHALTTKLIARADFVADVHSGDGAEFLVAFVGVYGGPLATDYKTALAFAEAMGFPRIVRYQMKTQAQIDTGRSLNRQAVASGLPTVLVEIGQNGSRDPAHVEAIVRGMQSAMATLGMLPADAKLEAGPPRYFEGSRSVRVTNSGIWYPVAASGRAIEAGETLGVIRDYTGALVETVKAPVSGYAIYGLAGPPVRAGDSVMSIVEPVDSLSDEATP